MPDAPLYDEDFVRWSEEQAAAIRRAAASGANLPLDWDNLAEEIESLGRSLRTELRSRLGTVIEHLLKLEHSPAAGPRAGWTETVIRERAEIALLIADNPSLRNDVGRLAESVRAKRAELAAFTLERHGELDRQTRRRIAGTRHTVEQVTGDWLPPGPGAA